MTRRHRGRPHGRGTELDRFADPAGGRLDMLANQVGEALRLALGALDDPRLDDAVLRDVVNEGSVLRAAVECPPEQVVDVRVALERAMPRLRFEIASEVHRKRLPIVRFVVLPRAPD